MPTDSKNQSSFEEESTLSSSSDSSVDEHFNKSQLEVTTLKAELSGSGKQYFPKAEEASLLILISVSGNEKYEAEFLNHIFELALKQKSVTFLLVDTPHRYNFYPLDPSSREAINRAKELGINWIKRNLECLSTYSGLSADEINFIKDTQTTEIILNTLNVAAKRTNRSFKIMCWDQWRDEIQCPAIDDTGFLLQSYNDSVSAEATTYLKRQIAANKNLEAIPEIKKRIEDFIYEESSLVTVGAYLKHYNLIAYAGSEPQWVKPARNLFLAKLGAPTIATDSHAIIDSSNKHAWWVKIVIKKVKKPTQASSSTFFSSGSPKTKHTIISHAPAPTPKTDPSSKIYFEMSNTLTDEIAAATKNGKDDEAKALLALAIQLAKKTYSNPEKKSSLTTRRSLTPEDKISASNERVSQTSRSHTWPKIHH